MLHPLVQMSEMCLAKLFDGHFIMAGLFGGHFYRGRFFRRAQRVY
jgi:hypothetical protein